MDPHLSQEEKIDRTLASIDGIRRAEAPAFFYTRLQARLSDHSTASGSFWAVLSKPAVSIVTLSLLLALNIAAVTHYLRNSNSGYGPAQTETGIQAFAEAYNLGGSGVFTDKTTDQ